MTKSDNKRENQIEETVINLTVAAINVRDVIKGVTNHKYPTVQPVRDFPGLKKEGLKIVDQLRKELERI